VRTAVNACCLGTQQRQCRHSVRIAGRGSPHAYSPSPHLLTSPSHLLCALAPPARRTAAGAGGAAVGMVGGPVGACMGCLAGIAAVACCYKEEAKEFGKGGV
jgi:hypothetical protein